jgi:hypothetical protein
MGEEMFVMHWLGKWELMLRVDLYVIKVYKKMHVARLKVRVKWGIGKFKCKWKTLMKHFDSIKEKYNHLFIAIALLINFLHKCR